MKLKFRSGPKFSKWDIEKALEQTFSVSPFIFSKERTMEEETYVNFIRIMIQNILVLDLIPSQEWEMFTLFRNSNDPEEGLLESEVQTKIEEDALSLCRVTSAEDCQRLLGELKESLLWLHNRKETK